MLVHHGSSIIQPLARELDEETEGKDRQRHHITALTDQ